MSRKSFNACSSSGETAIASTRKHSRDACCGAVHQEQPSDLLPISSGESLIKAWLRRLPGCKKMPAGPCSYSRRR
jgi:hypothetical protein